jgi:putative ABC transport system permease protein
LRTVKYAKISGETGAWPPPDKTLVIERSSLEYLGATIGDTIIVETSSEKEREMEIVGTAHDLSGMPASLSNAPTGFISRDTLEWLGESRDFSQLLYIVAENELDKAHIEAVGELIEKKVRE